MKFEHGLLDEEVEELSGPSEGFELIAWVI